MDSFRFVILGGGVVAGYAAQEFARCGIPAGELCIVSNEKTLPYDRPPLSKDYLANEKTTEEILINEPGFYEANGIEVRLDTAVTRVDLDNKKLYANGDTITYEKLLIATGSRPRTLDLPGHELDNIFYLRHINDARAIRQKAQQAKQAVVIGGSFIGMEATAVLQSNGVDTTLVFPEECVWQAFFTPKMSHFFESYYRDRGVTILSQEKVKAFVGNGRVQKVITESGKELPADIVVAGIGVVPNKELFADCGLQIADEGVVVNRFLETNFPSVVAAGDITFYEDVVYDKQLHIEHWDNAVQQGKHAARVMLGEIQPYTHVPYFFSDVFDLSYEFWGDPSGAAQTVHRGEVEDGRFSVWWLAEDGRLLAAFVMNRPDEEREMAPQWIQAGKKMTTEWLKETKNFEAESEKT
ncbi:MAG: NAD(P)/FAD-dependent oxidoreductase [Anaerolineaceae bacterium]|nr:NAD(P)/FAD-dependent oxidoreductase [Anaerolineaceae bacterium]